MRLTMSDQLARMLKAMPVRLKEDVKTDSVYLGVGFLEKESLEKPDVSVRVFLSQDGKTFASISSKEAGYTFSAPFDTEAEREAFPERAKKVIFSKMN